MRLEALRSKALVRSTPNSGLQENRPIAAGSLEYFFNHLLRPTNAAAMCLEILSPEFTADSTGLEIIKGLDDREAELIGTRDAAPRSPDFEYLDDLPCVLEIRSEEHRTTSMHRFDQIMSSDRHQCPAHERNRGCSVHRSQFA